MKKIFEIDKVRNIELTPALYLVLRKAMNKINENGHYGWSNPKLPYFLFWVKYNDNELYEALRELNEYSDEEKYPLLAKALKKDGCIRFFKGKKLRFAKDVTMASPLRKPKNNPTFLAQELFDMKPLPYACYFGDPGEVALDRQFIMSAKCPPGMRFFREVKADLYDFLLSDIETED